MTETAKITPSDIESKFRDMQGQIDDVAEDGKKKMAIAGVVAGVILLFVMYRLGRRTGKRNSTVLEIRRL